ncbi:MAG: rhodanese-like domain-containing protein [Methanothrix sp.]|nr:MAG: rhodanese-like domain-containing protein [Methanothrix sp.]
MTSQRLLLCLMALACLLVQACIADEETYSDPAVNELKNQVLTEQKTTSGSYKGQPWLTSPLNDSYKKTTSAVATPVQVAAAAAASASSANTAPSGNSLAEADSFLKGAAANGFYLLSVSNYLTSVQADPAWVVVDVRSADAYAQGHIQNALNAPMENLVSQMGLIPAGKKVAVYGDFDANAAFAVEALRVFAGRDAYVLQGGLPAWQAAGMQVVA